MGHVYGEVVIEGVSLNRETECEFKRCLKVPFKSENIVAIQKDSDGNETGGSLILLTRTLTLELVHLAHYRSSHQYLASFVSLLPRMEGRLGYQNIYMVC